MKCTAGMVLHISDYWHISSACKISTIVKLYKSVVICYAKVSIFVMFCKNGMGCKHWPRTHAFPKDEHKGLPSAGSSSEGQDSEKESENRGTLTFDATCAPAIFAFPRISPCNEAREYLEGMIGRFCRYYSLPLPRR